MPGKKKQHVGKRQHAKKPEATGGAISGKKRAASRPSSAGQERAQQQRREPQRRVTFADGMVRREKATPVTRVHDLPPTNRAMEPAFASRSRRRKALRKYHGIDVKLGTVDRLYGNGLGSGKKGAYTNRMLSINNAHYARFGTPAATIAAILSAARQKTPAPNPKKSRRRII